MDKLTQQISNEYVYCTKHTIETVKKNYIESGFTEDVDLFYTKIVKYFDVHDFEYTLKNGTVKTHVTKQTRYEDMQNMEPEELMELAWKVIIWSTLERTTFTSVVSKISKILPHIDRLALETASELLGILDTTDLIDVEYPRSTEEGVLMICPCITLDEELQEYLDGLRYVLPSLVKPNQIESNRDSGYQTFRDTVFTKGKHHEEYVNLHHLNRQNSIPLTMDERVYRITEPVFTEDKHDTPEETAKKLKAFKLLNYECIDLYAKFTGEVFYLTHRYDERLRTYTKGHHFSSQGADYQRGSIELAEPELIQK
jgi:hypothetical protein